MKKRFIKFILILICIIVFLKLVDNILYQNYADEYVKQGMKYTGNTIGNIAEEGYIAEDNGWYYYTNFNDSNRLYKIKKDGTEKQNLSLKHCREINVINSKYIYCAAGSPSHIYRINIDGSGKKCIVRKSVDFLTATDEFLFFIESDDLGRFSRLYRTDLNGNHSKILDEFVMFYGVKNDKIYYSNEKDNNSLYSMNLDGSDKIKLNDEYIWSINIYDDWIYYGASVSESDKNVKLYRIKTDGTNRELISDNKCWNVNVYKDKIFYRNQSDKGNLYIMDIDGNNNRKLAENNISYINVTDDYVLFYRITENSGNYILDSNGTEREDILNLWYSSD